MNPQDTPKRLQLRGRLGAAAATVSAVALTAGLVSCVSATSDEASPTGDGTTVTTPDTNSTSTGSTSAGSTSAGSTSTGTGSSSADSSSNTNDSGISGTDQQGSSDSGSNGS